MRHPDKGRQRLRRHAESSLRSGSDAGRRFAPSDEDDLAHELDVHAAELEIQNDELRAAQLELAEERDRYRELYDLAPVGYLTLDADGVIQRANRAAADITGVGLDTIPGRRLSGFLLPEDAIAFHHFVRRLRSSPERSSTQVRVGRGSDVVYVRLDAIRSASDDDGSVRFLFALVDVSEQRAVEKDLRDRDRRLHSVLDTTIDGIATFGRDGIVESVNRTAESMFGRPAGALCGHEVTELVAEPQRDSLRAWLAEHHRPDAPDVPTRRELIGLRTDGTTFPMEMGLGTSHDDELVFTAIVRDLTDRKQLEEQFLQAQKMEVVGRLASGVAHDFNNLLMGISGAADVALRRIDTEHEARRFLTEIKREALGGVGIVRQLLAFGRKPSSEPGTTDLDATIARSEGILTRLLGEDVRVRFQLDAPLVAVAMPSGQLQQILLNLAANARDAMSSHGGELSIATEPLGATGDAPARVRLCISDTGSGMDEQTLELVFEPFYSTKESGQGTGLGLWTIFSLVRDAGGQVDIDSTPGVGTTVVIDLPVVDWSQAPATGTPAEDAPRGHGETVLVVEDEAGVRRAVRDYLEEGGYRVLEAATCAEGLSMLRLYRDIELVLADVVLPDGTGPEMLTGQPRPSRALYMSAHPAELLHRAGRLPPGMSPLQKPFERERLLIEVRRALDDEPAAPHRAPPPEGRRPMAMPRRATVLFVEDHDITREAVTELLTDEGYDILTARSGAEARSVADRAGHVEVVVSDIRLPDTTGPELVDRLRARWPQLACVFTSGLAAESPQVREALTRAHARYLQKPVDFTLLISEIDALVPGKPEGRDGAGGSAKPDRHDGDHEVSAPVAETGPTSATPSRRDPVSELVHALRTPMQGVALSGDLLRRALTRGDEKSALRHLETTLRDVRRLDDVLREQLSRSQES